MPKVSVIIPCYNMGAFINETVDSVLTSTYKDYEIVIANDGSTDDHTNQLLADYNKPNTKVIQSVNLGLPGARNTATNNSSGKYILPLDADDKISPGYIADAVEYLDTHPNAGIVYCDAEYFGEQTGPYVLPEYSIEEMLKRSLIFCSAFCRREDYDAIGGWNTKMEYFYEDWDFWLSIIERGRDVYKIPETHFYYRIRGGSITRTRDFNERIKKELRKLYLNHLNLYAQHFQDPLSLWQERERMKASYEDQMKWIYNTADYKLGSKVLTPLRKIKSLFTK